MHLFNKALAFSYFSRLRNTDDTRHALLKDYDDAMAVVAFARSTFLHDGIVNVIFILAAAAIGWEFVVCYLSFYALVLLPTFRYQFVKHRNCALFKRIKPTVKF